MWYNLREEQSIANIIPTYWNISTMIGLQGRYHEI